MIDLTLTDAERKMLTGYTGECWHKLIHSAVCRPPICLCNGQETIYTSLHLNRTFDNYKDSLQLAKKMVEKGDWLEFITYAGPLWRTPKTDKKIELTVDCVREIHAEFYQWLFVDDPQRLPKLAAQYLKGEGK